MLEQMEGAHSKNRSFICSCQKAYLSYAALFTHIKQKHGGKAPGQIVRPRSLNKRGRPRKSQKPNNDRLMKSESYNGLSSIDINNNKRNNSQHSNYISKHIQSQLLPTSLQKINSNGFKSYKNSNNTTLLKKQQTLSKRTMVVGHCQYDDDDQQSQNCQYQQDNNSQEINQDQFQQQEDNIEFSHINNQFSNNTLTLASIIIGLQQTFKQAAGLEIVRDQKLQYFLSYGDLKKYHAMKLSLSPQEKKDDDVFMLGNVVCAFLNFCHQTLDTKTAYQHIVLLMVCLLDHIKTLKPYNTPGFNILTQCRKQVIHQSLPTFFEEYLQKVEVRYRMRYWIFRENNSFKVLIWFLNWLSAIEVNYLKNSMGNEKKEEKLIMMKNEEMNVNDNSKDIVTVKEQNGAVQGGQRIEEHTEMYQDAKNNTNIQQQQQQEHNKVDNQQSQRPQQQQKQSCQQQSEDEPQVQFENPVFFNTIVDNALNAEIEREDNGINNSIQKDKREQQQQSISSSSSSSSSSSPQHCPSSSSSQCQQQNKKQDDNNVEQQQNNEKMVVSNGLQRLSSEVR